MNQSPQLSKSQVKQFKQKASVKSMDVYTKACFGLIEQESTATHNLPLMLVNVSGECGRCAGRLLVYRAGGVFSF